MENTFSIVVPKDGSVRSEEKKVEDKKMFSYNRWLGHPIHRLKKLGELNVKSFWPYPRVGDSL